jgi:hypothetical protein
MTKRKRRPVTWSLVKFRCKVGDDTIRKVKALGMKPRTLLSSNASRRDEPWKSPVDCWIDDLYVKRFGARDLPETKSGNESH